MVSDKSPIKIIMAVIFMVIIIVVVFGFMGGTSEELKSAGDSVTNPNNCSTASGSDYGDISAVYNITDGFCYNDTSVGGEKGYQAGETPLPLSTLFGRNSVILLVVMAAILILLIAVFLSMMKKTKQ